MVCLTSNKHINGTERIAEAAKLLKASNDDIIIDIQGDEPLVSPSTISNVAHFMEDKLFDIVVPYLPLNNDDSENRVKLATSGEKVVFMSRAPIPFAFAKGSQLKKHLSIVGFRGESLCKFSSSEPTELEQIEGVELLRAIELGMNIGTFEENDSSISVDTQKTTSGHFD